MPLVDKLLQTILLSRSLPCKSTARYYSSISCPNDYLPFLKNAKHPVRMVICTGPLGPKSGDSKIFNSNKDALLPQTQKKCLNNACDSYTATTATNKKNCSNVAPMALLVSDHRKQNSLKIFLIPISLSQSECEYVQKALAARATMRDNTNEIHARAGTYQNDANPKNTDPEHAVAEQKINRLHTNYASDMLALEDSIRYMYADLPESLEQKLRRISISSIELNFVVPMPSTRDFLHTELSNNNFELLYFLRSHKNSTLTQMNFVEIKPSQSKNAVKIDPSKLSAKQLNLLKVSEFNSVQIIGVNNCSKALQNGSRANLNRRSYSTSTENVTPNDKSNRNPHIVCVSEGDKGCVSPGNADNEKFIRQKTVTKSALPSQTPIRGKSGLGGLMCCKAYANALIEAGKRRNALANAKLPREKFVFKKSICKGGKASKNLSKPTEQDVSKIDKPKNTSNIFHEPPKHVNPKPTKQDSSKKDNSRDTSTSTYEPPKHIGPSKSAKQDEPKDTTTISTPTKPEKKVCKSDKPKKTSTSACEPPKHENFCKAAKQDDKPKDSSTSSFHPPKYANPCKSFKQNGSKNPKLKDTSTSGFESPKHENPYKPAKQDVFENSKVKDKSTSGFEPPKYANPCKSAKQDDKPKNTITSVSPKENVCENPKPKDKSISGFEPPKHANPSKSAKQDNCKTDKLQETPTSAFKRQKTKQDVSKTKVWTPWDSSSDCEPSELKNPSKSAKPDTSKADKPQNTSTSACAPPKPREEVCSNEKLWLPWDTSTLVPELPKHKNPSKSAKHATSKANTPQDTTTPNRAPPKPKEDVCQSDTIWLPWEASPSVYVPPKQENPRKSAKQDSFKNDNGQDNSTSECAPPKPKKDVCQCNTIWLPWETSPSVYVPPKIENPSKFAKQDSFKDDKGQKNSTSECAPPKPKEDVCKSDSFWLPWKTSPSVCESPKQENPSKSAKQDSLKNDREQDTSASERAPPNRKEDVCKGRGDSLWLPWNISSSDFKTPKHENHRKPAKQDALRAGKPKDTTSVFEPPKRENSSKPAKRDVHKSEKSKTSVTSIRSLPNHTPLNSFSTDSRRDWKAIIYKYFH